MKNNTKILTEIIPNFQIQGEIKSITPYGSGHIQETFRLSNQDPDKDDYLLQKINTSIFKCVPELMDNILYVTNHIKNKVKTTFPADFKNRVLTVVPTTDGRNYYKDSDGEYWRIFLFIKGARSYDLVETRKQAYQGGRAYGIFQTLLADIDASKLHETLPNFHDLSFRLNNLETAIQNNPVNRLKDVAAEVKFIADHSEQMSTIMLMGANNDLPLKTTHNDTKFNNVLLDGNDNPQCVIDLDTVMQGYIAYDFGDAVRTIVNTAAEDEEDLEKIEVNMKLFQGFAEGFLEESRQTLNKYEIGSLAHGCLLLPFLMATRFLTDYIEGDCYYKISFPNHNLQRARAQIRLTEKLIEKFPEIASTINRLCSNH